MATGDINSRALGRAGNHVSVSGSFESGDNQILYISGSVYNTGNHIVSFQVTPADDLADKTWFVRINENDASSTSYPGAVWFESDAAGVNTYYYHALMQM